MKLLVSFVAGGSQFSKPFPHFRLPDFFTSKEFVADLRSELKTVRYHRKENDLFSLNQTVDLSNFDARKFPALTKFRQGICLLERHAYQFRVS